jgi:hypothetical protein
VIEIASTRAVAVDVEFKTFSRRTSSVTPHGPWVLYSSISCDGLGRLTIGFVNAYSLVGENRITGDRS